MKDIRELWERIGDLPGGRKNPFEDPYGPTAECFSDNDVVRMFRLGAEKRAVDHLSSCKECESRIEAFAQVTGQDAPQPETAASRLSPWLEPLLMMRPARADLLSTIRARTLVYVASECVVKLDRGEVESIRVQLITKNVGRLRAMNIYLEGPFTAESRNIVINEAGYPSIELHNVKASRDILRDLRGHGRLTKQLEVRIGETAEHARLIGTSNIDFKRADSTLEPSFT